MAITYSSDADIANREPVASDLNAGSSDFSRQRGIAYKEIGRRLARRNPPIDQSCLGTVEDLREAEVLYVLHRLFFEAASRATPEDPLWAKAKAYRNDFEDEIQGVPLGVDAVPSYGSSPIRRS